MMAVPFDPVQLEVIGTPAPVLEGVMASTGNTGAGQFSFSQIGLLVYVPGGSQGSESTPVWVDRKGAAQPLAAPPRSYAITRLSPDGQRVAAQIEDHIWVYDIRRETLTRLTFEGVNRAPMWTADGKRVVFASSRAGPSNLFWKPADGSGSEERLTRSQYPQLPSSSSPDGKFLTYRETGPATAGDVWAVPLDGERKARVFVQTPYDESSAKFSPDGSWLAYVSNESGRAEVYVQPFPGPGGKWQISTDGGTEPAWAMNGELFYRNGDRMMVVDTTLQPTFAAGKPQLLFEGSYVRNPAGAGTYYSVTVDGQRFLMLKPREQPQAALTQIHVVLNWFEELKRRVPTR
jgi:serine/threonine-protein kinase